MIDASAIAKFMSNLSQEQFKTIAHLVLSECFSQKLIDVDGKGDGGTDFSLFGNLKSETRTALQTTIQDSGWKTKAYNDAKKAKNDLKANRYYFITNRIHEYRALVAVENKIDSELGIPAKCLGGREIAGLIIEFGLLTKFASLLGLGDFIQMPNSLDKPGRMLYMYSAISIDKKAFKDKVIDDTIMSTIVYANRKLTINEVLESTALLLGSDDIRKDRIRKRFDSLRARSHIVCESDKCSLASDLTEYLKITNLLYFSELQELQSIQNDVIVGYKGKWDVSKAKDAAVALANLYVREQVKTASLANLSVELLEFTNFENDPETSLKNLILEAGVEKKNTKYALMSMIENSRSSILVKKLTRAVVYIALENTSPNKTSIILGSEDWSNVFVYLDTSVIIPYLCSSLYSTTHGRFSMGAHECILTLKELSAKMFLAEDYLEECATHLINAQNYCQVSEFDDELQYSENGFVSHYFQLKVNKVKVPKSLQEYLSNFSNSLYNVAKEDYKYYRKQVMIDLQRLLTEYGVIVENIGVIHSELFKNLEITCCHVCDDLKRNRPPILIKHDCRVLGHLSELSKDHSSILFLTWDAVLIEMAKKSDSFGWVISPDKAADILQPKIDIEASTMSALAHHIARSMHEPDEAGAIIIDRIIETASQQMQDYEFRNKVREFKTNLINSIDFTSANFFEKIHRETDSFLQEMIGIIRPEDVSEETH